MYNHLVPQEGRVAVPTDYSENTLHHIIIFHALFVDTELKIKQT
jgi:hypothetical protein